MIKSKAEILVSRFQNLPRCGAKARRYKRACKNIAMKNRARCRLHGGKCTGPKTLQGKLNSAKAQLKHGRYTKEAISERMKMRTMMQWRNDLKEI